MYLKLAAGWFLMYVHNLDPVLFSLGPVEIRYYGIIYALGFLLLYYVFVRFHKEVDFTKDEAEQYVVYVILGLLIGSRLGSVLLWSPGYYLAHPLEILAIWKGGMAFHGGLVGVLVAGWLFCKKYKKNMGKVFDLTVLPTVLGLALGRLGNFVNGELWGTPFDVSWCVQFQNV